MNLRNIIFLSLLLIIVLASCTPRSVTSPMATMTYSSTKNPTSIITLTQSAAITRTPSKTPRPSRTPEPTVGFYAMASKVSPNGEYVAYAYFYWNEDQTIEIKDKDGKLIWQIPFQGGSPKGYYPRATMGIYRWSDDSTKLYFCYFWGSDGGDPPFQASCYNLQQVDIKTGKVQSVVISFDETRVGYVDCQDEPCTIHVQNISTSLDKFVPYISESNEHLTPMGWMIDWSFDDIGFIFHLIDQNHIIQTIYFNTLTMEYKVIKKYPAPETPGWADYQGWVDDNTVEFLESGGTGLRVVHVNIKSGKTIDIGTPTPTPTPEN